MSEIPNVSLVMRELSGLSNQVDSLIKHNDVRSGVADSHAIQREIQSFESMGNNR
jgi:hypothetical protein